MMNPSAMASEGGIVRLATRGSPLALSQARMAANAIKRVVPSLEIVTLPIKTKGDRILDAPLEQIGGKGLFTKEIDTALLEGSADLAVHSLKDLPTDPVDGLFLAAVLERDYWEDVIVTASVSSLEELPKGSELGCGSARRREQLRRYRPDLRFHDLRGNIQTRLEKVYANGWQGAVLSRAGIERLGLNIPCLSLAKWLLPAAGQGCIGLVCRTGDTALRDMLASVNHRESYLCAMAERGFWRKLGGGCHMAAGVLARMSGDEVEITAGVFDPGGPADPRVSGRKRYDEWEREGDWLVSQALRAAGR